MTEIKTHSKLKTVKMIVRSIVGYSVAGVIVTIIHQNTQTFSKSQKAQLYIGAFVIGSMVCDNAKDYTDDKIDKIVESIDSTKKALDEAKTVN